MLELIYAGICIAIGFFVAIFVGIYVVLNEILKSILVLFRSKE